MAGKKKKLQPTRVVRLKVGDRVVDKFEREGTVAEVTSIGYVITWADGTSSLRSAVEYVPTEDVIAEGAAAIRAKWTPDQEQKRRVQMCEPLELPTWEVLIPDSLANANPIW